MSVIADTADEETRLYSLRNIDLEGANPRKRDSSIIKEKVRELGAFSGAKTLQRYSKKESTSITHWKFRSIINANAFKSKS